MQLFHTLHPKEHPDMAHILLTQPLTSAAALLSLLCQALQHLVQTGAGTHRDIRNSSSGTSFSTLARDVLAGFMYVHLV